MSQQSINAPALDDVGPSPVVEKIVHGVVWALLGVSIVGIAFIFGFDPGNWFSVDNASASIRAVAVDFTFYGGLYFARRFWNRRRRTLGSFLWGCFWFLIALAAACLSWFSNSLFITKQHLVTQALLNDAGFAWMTAQLVNQIVGAIPIVIILLYSFVPRQQQTDTRTPEQIKVDAERELALLKAKSAVEAQKAKMAGSRLRGVVGGFVDQAFNLEEKRQQEATKNEQRQARRERHDRLMGLAHIHGLDPAADDLEAQLTAIGAWPTLDTSATSSATEEATDSAKQRAIKRPLSGPLPTRFTASEIAAKIGKPVRTVSRWMSEDYKGPYKIHARFIKSRNARCANASEIARIIVLLKGENPPIDTPDEAPTQPSLEAMPALVVSQEEGQMNGHPNGHRKRQPNGQPQGHDLGQLDGQDEEIE